jgi:peptide/nickel transport system ATP-binding protein
LVSETNKQGKKLLETIDLVTNFYTYEGIVKALNQVSLRVDHGATFGLVGESGCGKSVMARSIMRIVPPPGIIENGKVLFYKDGNGEKKAIDILQQPEVLMEDLRGNEISMIFQEPNASLNPIMSIGEQVAESFLFHRKKEMCAKILEELNAPSCNIFLPIRMTEKLLYKKIYENPNAVLLRIMGKIPLLKHWDKRLKREALRRAIEMIGQLSIPNPEEIVKRYPHNLSGGMKQRILIAIALACQPAMLIADEATSNLDVTIQAQILDLLRELKRTQISSILFITHDLGIVAEICDRVGVMYAGNICEVAEVKELFNNPQHPYTVALLEAVPKFSQQGELKTIEGNVPNLVRPPTGCRFHPRCKQAKDICQKQRPPLVEINPDHWIACHA